MLPWLGRRRFKGTGWPTCRFRCPRCKKAVRDAKFSHLAPQNLHVGSPFSPVGRPFLHLGSRNLNVEPPFSLVGRTVYYFTISFPLGSRQRFLHLGSRHLNVEPPFSPGGRTHPEFFLHLGQPILHVGSRFCMSAKRIPRFKALRWARNGGAVKIPASQGCEQGPKPRNNKKMFQPALPKNFWVWRSLSSRFGGLRNFRSMWKTHVAIE